MIFSSTAFSEAPFSALATDTIDPPPDPPPPVEGGTGTITRTRPALVDRTMFQFTCDEDGNCEITTSYDDVDGKLFQVSIIPGDPAPTNNFDVFLFDEDRHDLLLGSGRNLSSTAQAGLSSNQLAAAAGTALTLTVINGGDGGSGTVLVYVR